MKPDHIVTAAEMGRMSPNERAAAVAAGTITDMDELPAPIRAAVEQKAAEWTERIASGRA